MTTDIRSGYQAWLDKQTIEGPPVSPNPGIPVPYVPPAAGGGGSSGSSGSGGSSGSSGPAPVVVTPPATVQGSHADFPGMSDTDYKSVQSGAPYVRLTNANNQAIVTMLSDKWDKLTPNDKFYWLQKVGRIPGDAQLTINADGSWGYISKSEQGNTGYTNGIPTDLYKDYLKNQALYTKYNKAAPFFVDNTQHSPDGSAVVVAIPFDNPTNPLVVTAPDTIRYKFKNIGGNAVINQILNKNDSTVVLQSDAKGNFTDADILKAINTGKLSRQTAITLFGSDNVSKILNVANPSVATITKGSADMDYISAHQEGAPNVQAAEPTPYTSAKTPKGFIEFDSIVSQGKGNGYKATFNANGVEYVMNFQTYEAAKKYEVKAQNASANLWDKVVSKVTGTPLSNEMVIQRDANQSHASTLAKVISKVTGTPMQNVDVSPRGVMNFLNKPEVQLIGLGGAGALDEGVAVGNKTATAVIQALSKIPKPIVYGAQAAMSGYSGVSTAINWGSMSVTEREAGIAGAVFPIVAVTASEVGNMPKSNRVSVALDDYNTAAKVVAEKQGILQDTPENSAKFSTVRDEALNAAADANTAKNRLESVLDENGNTKIAKYVKNQITTKLATDAGIASRSLTEAETALKTTYGTPKYDIAAADAQKAIATARLADRNFTDRIAATDNLTSKQLKTYEKLSGYDGLTQSVKDVNTASNELKSAWADVDAGKLKVGKGASIEAKLGSPEYLQNLERVAAARAKLDAALTKYNDVISVRTKVSPATGYDGIISQTEKDISGGTAELSRLEAKYNQSISDSMKVDIHNDWLEAQNSLASDQVKLQLLKAARDAGVPAPTIQKVFFVKPTPREMLSLIDSINKYNLEHPTESYSEPSRGEPLKTNRTVKTSDGMEMQLETKTETKKLPTLEKPRTLKPQLEIDSKEIVQPGESIVKVKTEPKSAPKIIEDEGVINNIAPAWYQNKGWGMSRPVTTTLSAQQSGQTNAANVTAGVIQQEFVTPKGTTLSNFDTGTQDAIINITEVAVQNINKMKSQPNPATANEVKAKTNELIKDGVRNITNTNIRNQVAPLAQTMTQTAVKVATKTMTKTATVTPPPPVNKYQLPGNKPVKNDKNYVPSLKDIENATTYKAGFGWWLRFPNGQWRFYRALPHGAKEVAPGKGSGKRSVQTLEGAPIEETHRMGFMNVRIDRPSKQPGRAGAIAYQRNGAGRPGLSVERHGGMIHIKGVGLANIHHKTRGRILHP